MEKYGFNLQELRSKKEKLESLVYSTDLTDDEAEDILNLITMYDSVLDNFVHSDDEIRDEMSKESLLSDFKDFVTYDDYNDEHIIVRNKLCLLLSKLVSRKNSYSFDELNLTDSEAVELVGDMIKSKLGMNHYNIYKSLFLNDKSHVQFSNSISSALLVIPNTKESFAIIHDHPDIAKASDLAHEAGHLFSSKISSSYMLPNSILDEVESIFYELLFIDFLLEEKIYPEDSKNLFSELITSSIQRAYILNVEFSYPMYKLNSIRDFKTMANKYDLYNITGIFNSKDLLEWINIYNDENPFMYVYSFLIALELYDQYKINRNKKSVVSKYEKFISQVGTIPDFKLASCISRDYVGFDRFKTLRKYRSKFIKE
ncbi:MAG: hypothetical protein IK997_05220 [Bacilli bacterium]|nr:hypothetical protein [Bacilli bacterium]